MYVRDQTHFFLFFGKVYDFRGVCIALIVYRFAQFELIVMFDLFLLKIVFRFFRSLSFFLLLFNFSI